jgi:hypothetical protein
VQSGEPDVIFFAPRHSVCRIADQCSEARLQTLSDWTRLLETAFYSLPTTIRFRTTIERSQLPAYFFATPLNVRQTRSACYSITGDLVCFPSPQCSQRNKPVARLPLNGLLQ